MICPNCGGSDVKIDFRQVSAKTKGNGMGCLWTLGRWCLVFCTLGLWLLVGKRKKTEKTIFKHEKVALCQKCGHSWTIED